MPRLHRADAFLIVIDVQLKLMPVISERETVERNIERLVRGSRIVDIPALLTEQYVQGLGADRSDHPPRLRGDIGIRADREVVFLRLRLRGVRHRHAQPASQASHRGRRRGARLRLPDRRRSLANGYDVTIVADAISSRTQANKEIAIRRMISDGARLSSTEMVLFELTVNSGTDEFREMSRLVK